MDRNLLDEIIEDYEKMLGIIAGRLNELKAMRRGGKTNNIAGNSIKNQIEAKRREIMAQVENVKGNVSINRSKSKDG